VTAPHHRRRRTLALVAVRHSPSVAIAFACTFAAAPPDSSASAVADGRCQPYHSLSRSGALTSVLPSIHQDCAAGGGGRARQRRCTLRRVPRVDAPRSQRRCGVHGLCYAHAVANYLLAAHGGARGPTGFTERTRAGFEPHGVCGACGPVPADRGRRARGAAQRGAASLRRLAQARADLQGSSTPPLGRASVQ
jgi:hypothetical protein